MEKKIIQDRGFWPIIKLEGFPAIYYKVRTIELADYPYEYSESDWYFQNKPITSYLVIEVDDLNYLKELSINLPTNILEEDSIIIDLESKEVYRNETEAIGIQLSKNIEVLNLILKDYRNIQSVDYNFEIVREQNLTLI